MAQATHMLTPEYSCMSLPTCFTGHMVWLGTQSGNITLPGSFASQQGSSGLAKVPGDWGFVAVPPKPPSLGMSQVQSLYTAMRLYRSGLNMLTGLKMASRSFPFSGDFTMLPNQSYAKKYRLNLQCMFYLVNTAIYDGCFLT